MDWNLFHRFEQVLKIRSDRIGIKYFGGWHVARNGVIYVSHQPASLSNQPNEWLEFFMPVGRSTRLLQLHREFVLPPDQTRTDKNSYH